MRLYEAVYIIDPALDEAGINEKLERFHGLAIRNGGEVVARRSLGRIASLPTRSARRRRATTRWPSSRPTPRSSRVRAHRQAGRVRAPLHRRAERGRADHGHVDPGASVQPEARGPPRATTTTTRKRKRTTTRTRRRSSAAAAVAGVGSRDRRSSCSTSRMSPRSRASSPRAGSCSPSGPPRSMRASSASSGGR
jgi:hypothetical protein